jgi:hypothetical protein
MSARPGPCGGHRVTGVPTAISLTGGKDALYTSNARRRERAPSATGRVAQNPLRR